MFWPLKFTKIPSFNASPVNLGRLPEVSEMSGQSAPQRLYNDEGMFITSSAAQGGGGSFRIGNL